MRNLHEGEHERCSMDECRRMHGAEHSWFTGKLPKEEVEKRKKAQDDFKSRYA
ncbi:MAG: hypothetical protein JSW50_15225 [Candidatus Latescibacterota bacterium]|nr:MAG: hypothetical protein JSW50_15225 [Candidatus Latescibacterota bacterium]